MSIGSQLRTAREGLNLSASDVAAATRSKVQFIEAIERDDYSVFAAPIYGKGFIRLYAVFVGLDPQPLLDAYAAAVRARKQPSLVSEGGPPPAPNPPPATSKPEARQAAEGAEAATPSRGRTREFDLFNATPGAAAPVTPLPLSPSPPAAPVAQAPQAAQAEQAEQAAPPVRSERAERAAAARELFREVVIRWWLELRESWSRSKSRAAEMHPERDPWKVAPIVIGIVIILIFVVSGLSRCAHRRDAAAKPVRAVGGDLRLAAEAPEPYFD